MSVCQKVFVTKPLDQAEKKIYTGVANLEFRIANRDGDGDGDYMFSSNNILARDQYSKAVDTV